MQEVNKFIKGHLKTKKIRVEDFIKLCDISRSMLYRILNGQQKPSNELIDTMANVLNLNDVEKSNLIYCCSLIDNDENLSSSRNAVNNFLFSEPDTEYEKIEFIYYKDDNKYIKTFDEVLQELLVDSDFEDFHCDMRILNCFDNGILNNIFDTFSKLTANTKSFNIEHLVRFTKNTYENNINLLRDIIQLTMLGKYKVLYKETDYTDNDNVFENLLILDYKYKLNGTIVNKKIIMSFLNDNLSTCYVIDNMNLYDFFDRNYNSLKKHYKVSFHNMETINMWENTFVKMENQYNMYLFKHDFCYNRIPVEVIENMINTVPENEKVQFFKMNLNGDVEQDKLELYEKYLCDFFQHRIDLSRKYKHTDILTTHGLEEFAKTGLLSDTKDNFPPFGKKERKIILEYIKNRNNDKNDSYKLYIVDKKYTSEDIHIICFQDYGLIVEYSNPLQNNTVMYQIIIEHKKLADVFLDFAENYVPTRLSLQKNKINDFIDELIVKYCSDT